MGKPLYEMTTEIRELKALADTDPEMEVAVADTLEAIQMDFNDKALAVARISLNLAPDVEAIDNEIKRLQARKKLYANHRARLIDYLRQNMVASEITKIECPLFRITLAKGREKVIVDDQELIPDDYMRVPDVQAECDKKKVMDAHKEGEEVPGTHVERGQPSILIK